MEAAATAGVGVLVGTFTGGLRDDVATVVGIGFHRILLQGTPAAYALNRATSAAAPPNYSDPSHLSYAMSGYGHFMFQP